MFSKVLVGTMIGSLLSLLCPAFGAGQNDSGAKPSDSQTVTMWVSEVATANPDIWEELGKFPTYQEALACSERWSKANPKSLRLTNEREIKVRIIPPGPGAKVQSPSVTKPDGTTVPPKPLAARTDPMEGMWVADCGSFYFSNGSFAHICSGNPLQGRYQLNGVRIQLKFDNGTSIIGNLKNGRVDGTMTNPKSGVTKAFTFKKR